MFVIKTKSKVHLKRLLITVFFCLLLISAYTQKDFRPAYIIDLSNDTLTGLINYNGDLFNVCEFKTTSGDETKLYGPSEILSFRFIDDKYYISKVVTIQNSYKKIINVLVDNNNEKGRIISSKYELEGISTEKVFVEFLVNGELNLYYFRDRNDVDHYFLENKELQITDLAEEEVNIYRNESLSSSEKNNKYKGKIKSLMQDCPQINSQIENISLDQKKMINLTSKYHDYMCKDRSCIIYKRKLAPTSLDIELYGGVNYTKTINIGIYNPGQTKYIMFDQSLAPSIGINLQVSNIFPALDKASIKVCTKFTRQSYKKDVSFGYSGKYTDTTISFQYSQYNFYGSLLGIYNTTTKPNTPYIILGIVFKQTFADEFYNKNTYFRIKNDNYPYNFGLVVGLGYEMTISDNSRKLFTTLVLERAST